MLQFVYNLLKLRCSERKPCIMRCNSLTGVAASCLTWDTLILLKKKTKTRSLHGIFWATTSDCQLHMSLLCLKMVLSSHISSILCLQCQKFQCNILHTFTFMLISNKFHLFLPGYLLGPILSSTISISSSFYFFSQVRKCDSHELDSSQL